MYLATARANIISCPCQNALTQQLRHWDTQPVMVPVRMQIQIITSIAHGAAVVPRAVAGCKRGLVSGHHIPTPCNADDCTAWVLFWHVSSGHPSICHVRVLNTTYNHY